MKLKKSRWFISLYTGWLQNIYDLGLQYEKRHITLETLRINFAFLYLGQFITKIVSAIVAPSYGTTPRVMQSSYSRALHSWKAAFYLIFFRM